MPQMNLDIKLTFDTSRTGRKAHRKDHKHPKLGRKPPLYSFASAHAKRADYVHRDYYKASISSIWRPSPHPKQALNPLPIVPSKRPYQTSDPRSRRVHSGFLDRSVSTALANGRADGSIESVALAKGPNLEGNGIAVGKLVDMEANGIALANTDRAFVTLANRAANLALVGIRAPLANGGAGNGNWSVMSMSKTMSAV
ncbi:hypothetical protein MMC18_006237 [Xylographa bjoerkii]|nr:hypothetical protein [Xylographa bjoerkii]